MWFLHRNENLSWGSCPPLAGAGSGTAAGPASTSSTPAGTGRPAGGTAEPETPRPGGARRSTSAGGPREPAALAAWLADAGLITPPATSGRSPVVRDTGVRDTGVRDTGVRDSVDED